MGRRIPIVIRERTKSDLSEDKMSPNPENTTPEKHEPESEPPPVINEGTTSDEEKEHKQCQNDYRSLIQKGREFLHCYFPTPQGFFNGIVAMFTAATCLVTYWQYTAQLVDQRAWVGVVAPVVPELRVGERAIFSVRIMNSGKTPARKVLSHVGVRFMSKDKPLDILYQEPPPTQSHTILSPNMQMDISNPNPDPKKIFTEDRVNNVKNGNEVVYLYGKISYEDIFGYSHCRTFCVYLSPDFKLNYACKVYNEETDARCPD